MGPAVRLAAPPHVDRDAPAAALMDAPPAAAPVLAVPPVVHLAALVTVILTVPADVDQGVPAVLLDAVNPVGPTVLPIVRPRVPVIAPHHVPAVADALHHVVAAVAPRAA